MKTVYLDYRMLDGEIHRILKQVGSGRVIRLFNRTPFPEQLTDVVCPHFHQLACVYGCPYNCAWCYIKGTFRFFQQSNGRIPVKLKKEKDIVAAIRTFLTLGEDEVPATVLNTGELADSLCTEGATAFYGKPFSEYIMSYFEGTRHKVLFLSKGTNVKNFLNHEWQENAILSWTINAYPVAERWEKLAPHPKDRIKAAEKVAKAGYEVRVRIDPMVAVDGFEQYYQKLVDDLFEAFTPSRITLGCLRGLTSTMARAVDKSWIPFLTEKSSWGRKPPIETRFNLYANILNELQELGFDWRGERLREHVGVCKDTLEIWEMLKKQYGLDFQKIKCNCIL